jgi:hypothetical protein
VESALAAINTAHNQVSSDISLAHAAADQRVVQSRARWKSRLARAGRSRAGKTLAAELAALTARAAFSPPIRCTCAALYDKAQQIYMRGK